VLVEREELPAGSTLHVGGMHTLNGDRNVARLQQYTVNLYKEIEKESGKTAAFTCQVWFSWLILQSVLIG